MRVKNFFRWIQAHIISWSVLVAAYFFVFWVVFETVANYLDGIQFSRVHFWFALLGVLVLAPLLEKLELGALNMKFSYLSKKMRESLIYFYLINEFRRPQTWVSVVIVSLAGVLFYDQLILWCLVAQLGVQRSLYSVNGWRNLILTHSSKEGGSEFVLAFTWTHGLLVALAWAMTQFFVLILALAGYVELLSWNQIVSSGAVLIGGVVAAAAVVMEGDSGRPGLVNTVSLISGMLMGLFCMISPWFFLVSLYFAHKTAALAVDRLKSVEFFDEDVVVS